MIKTSSYWQEETGFACVALYDSKLDKEFIGEAWCHELDKDMQSQLTGLTIAEFRANLNLFKHHRKIYKDKLQVLQNFEKKIIKCKHYNPEFQVETLLSQEIEETTKQIANIQNDIDILKSSLQKYIQTKGELYQKIRERRNKNKKGE